MMLYFAYGSNMSERRLRQRVPSAIKICVATLPGHRLAFHKVSLKDGSGKCDAYPVDDLNEVVRGVLFQLRQSEASLLDSAEGLGIGYEIRTIGVVREDGTQEKAFAYFALRIDSSLRPYHWYKEHVLRGAIENRLPKDYVQFIHGVASMEDPDTERAAHELCIYR